MSVRHWRALMVASPQEGSGGPEEALEARVRLRTTELTEILQREQAARAEAESTRSLFQGLLESAPDGIVIVNAEARITFVNGQAEQLSGYGREELIGKPVEVLIPERYAEIHVKHRNGYIAAPRTRPMGVGLNLYLRGKDGSEMPVEISLSPFGTPQGLLVTASVRNITDRQRTEAEIRRLNEERQQHVEQLEAANKEMEAFTYSVSHDLRTPLRSIDGFSQALLDDYRDQLDAQGQNYLQRVRGAAQRMGQLIDDLLRLSRLGRMEKHIEQVNLSDMAATIMAELRQRSPERTIVADITPNVVAAGDSELLHIVLKNLLSNAWKFTGKCDIARIEFGVTAQDSETVYFVRDNGAGFEMAYADKLFMPFQRLHGMEEFPGTGIGLAIVQRIIHRHGGRVWAEGAVDQGATVYFTLPPQTEDGKGQEQQ
ncbi:MAG: sensor histidine kinase [Armatimonadota bacterium]